ncbi:MAG TPA: ATP-dependent DNA ligase [Terriglobales bacterium]|nr:ATP-dependent DNA ligase [Terriglobales bacterium]
MQQLAQVAERIAGTRKKGEKVAIVAEHLRALSPEEASLAALFLSGRPFPAWEEITLSVGGALLWRALQQISGKNDAALAAAYRKHGDLGSAAHDLLAGTAAAKSTLALPSVASRFREIARVSGTAKVPLVIDLLRRATALEAKYLVKIMTGEMRIGLKESLVEEAIAKAFEAPVKDVQRANMLLGDIAATLALAARHALGEARMRLFHPLGFMLASPAADAEEAFSYFHQAQVEDKYDGIRAQAHCGAQAPFVRLFSRTLDDVSAAFPELLPPLRSFQDVILDGEIVAWQSVQRAGVREGRALPFSELQKRLGRKRVTRELMHEIPVVYVAFDVLYANGELMLDRPLHERTALLDRIFQETPVASVVEVEDAQGRLAFEPALSADATLEAPGPQVIRAPVVRADSAAHLDQLFELARERGNEGLMIKDVTSPYQPGRRGRAWLKLKRELATLDVVVTAVEYGHGKRNAVLSDYTFAIRAGEGLQNVGKAYSGLTDAEIAELTQWFLAHTLADQGHVRLVEPKVVVEVAFNAVMKSDRHASGYALRFPRIVRIRGDKRVEDIDTIERVRQIYEAQKAPEVRLRSSA